MNLPSGELEKEKPREYTYMVLTGIRRPGWYGQPVGAFSSRPPRIRTGRAERCARHSL
jgi:hypothetical protein